MDEQNQLQLMSGMLDKVLQGDLAHRLDASLLDGEAAALYGRICRLLEMQAGYVNEMQAASGKIMSVTEDLTTTIDESNQISEELTQSTEKLGRLNSNSFEKTVGAIGTIKELVSHLDEIRACTKDASDSNTMAGEAITDGVNHVFGLIELIGAIESSSKKTVEFVEKFKVSAEQITQILKTVDNIARQTQILSFNASIESKRAGAAGKGFGVIAGAIRDLAGESKAEVGNIEDVVQKITSGLSDLTEHIYSDYKNVGESVDRTKTIEGSFNRIKDTYSGLSGLIDRIASMTEVENTLAENVSAEILSVEENSRAVTEGFDAVADAIGNQRRAVENLSRQGVFLKDATESFTKLTARSADVQVDHEQVMKLANETFDLLRRQVLTQPLFAALDAATHRDVLDHIMQAGGLEAVWSNDPKGRFVYSNPPAGILNAKARDWFKESAAGKDHISDVYVSAITKKPCVTVALPIRDESGRIVGVLGADLKL